MHSVQNLVVTGGAGFVGSNLTLALQEKFPQARLTVIDDFRSGDFKNLAGYRGDFVAQNLATLDWNEQFGGQKFDAVFHLASITDTTNHDQFEQVHDNVESFRRILNFARPTKTRIVYASSAATYGLATEASAESSAAAPANIYAFSKVIMDNIARQAAAQSSDWIIVGLRYFNVYGPREAHKGVPASMVYHLSRQMKSGQRPRIFKHGEQKRDFVYVKDVVEGTIGALDAKVSGIYNLGSGQARSFNELVDVLNKCSGHKLSAGLHRQSARALSKLHASRSHKRSPLVRIRATISTRRGRARLHALVIRSSARVWSSGASQIAKGFLGQLKFVPFVVDCRTEALIKIDAPLIPFGDPPFDHPATRLLGFSGNSFHQLSAYSSTPVSIGNIELLDDQIRLRSIRKRNEIINQKSDQIGTFFRDKTMKIRWRTQKSLFA